MFGHDEPKDDENQNQEHIQPEEHQDNTNEWQHPGKPLNDTSQADDQSDDQAQPEDEAPEEEKPAPEVHESHVAEAEEPAGFGGAHHTDELIDIKQDALTKLTPLVGHLDQKPEERFRTLMMMIQASDDQSLVKQAYEAAQQIEDEKARAQALLDIVNEINYFTQHKSD